MPGRTREARRQGDTAEARTLRFKDETLGPDFFDRTVRLRLARYPDHTFMKEVARVKETLYRLAEDPEDTTAEAQCKEAILGAMKSLEEAERTGPLESWGRGPVGG